MNSAPKPFVYFPEANLANLRTKSERHAIKTTFCSTYRHIENGFIFVSYVT